MGSNPAGYIIYFHFEVFAYFTFLTAWQSQYKGNQVWNSPKVVSEVDVKILLKWRSLNQSMTALISLRVKKLHLFYCTIITVFSTDFASLT